MESSIFQLLTNNVRTLLIREPLLWGFYAIIVINTEYETLEEEFLFEFFWMFVKVRATDPFVL